MKDTESPKEEEAMAKKAKQGDLPGMERPEPKHIKELDDAAEAYVEARDARMKKTEAEKEQKEALISAMKKHGVLVYRDESVDPPLIVTLVDKTNVKVTEVEESSEEEAA